MFTKGINSFIRKPVVFQYTGKGITRPLAVDFQVHDFPGKGVINKDNEPVYAGDSVALIFDVFYCLLSDSFMGISNNYFLTPGTCEKLL